MEEATWDGHIPSLLEMILERLPVPDYLRFPAVCSSWRNVQRDSRRLYASSPRHERQKPWLMFQYYGVDHFMLYNPSEQRYYRFPSTSQRYFCGCSHGWLILLDYSTKELYFVNPFTASEITLTSINERIKGSWGFPSFGILSSVPTDSDCIFVLRIQGVYYFINGNSGSINDIIDVQTFWPTCAISGSKFYMLDKLNLILIESFPALSKSVIEMEWNFSKLPRGIRYLIESDGDLLMAIWDSKDGVPQVSVFKADLSHNVWVLLESFNDRILLLRSGQSLSLSAVEAGGSGNQIYYEYALYNEQDTDEELMGLQYDYKTHLVIRNKLPPSEPGVHGFMCGPFWIVPNLASI